MGDKVSAADKTAIESAMEAVKKANESNDSAAIEKALEQLTQAQHKAAEAMYRQQAPGGGAAGQAGQAGQAWQAGQAGQAGQGDVIDAEVVDEGKS